MNYIEVPALAIRQISRKRIFAFAIDGKEIPSFASISRAGRDETGELVGYQRPEVRRHISEIRDYIESSAPMIPNALVMAFDKRVRFTASTAEKGKGPHAGMLRIPVDPEDGSRRAAWIVDGQQRVAAIREASVKEFPIFAIGFVAASDEEAREQFLLVNNTKPLPRGLIHELLPAVSGPMPKLLDRRKVPTRYVELLNYTELSPLHLAVAMATNPGGRVKDNSLIRHLENSLSDGVLYRIHVTEDEDHAHAISMSVLCSFWGAVQETWPHLWELPPRKSRMLHGAGIVSLGFIMDTIASRFRDEGWPDKALFRSQLALLEPHCRWNEGHWDFGGGKVRRWDEIQNTTKEITMLSNHLVRIYLDELRSLQSAKAS